jgi:glyoxylase-like metal-dependent hydrolase (beta-lactamase superfamily II)
MSAPTHAPSPSAIRATDARLDRSARLLPALVPPPLHPQEASLRTRSIALHLRATHAPGHSPENLGPTKP